MAQLNLQIILEVIQIISSTQFPADPEVFWILLKDLWPSLEHTHASTHIGIHVYIQIE